SAKRPDPGEATTPPGSPRGWRHRAGRLLSVAVVLVGSLLVACGGAGPSAYGRDVRVGAVSGEGGAIVTQAELNQDVERFVSEFMFDVAQAMQAIEEAPEPRVRALGQRRTLVYYATALDIASGPLSRAERRGHARLRDAGSRCPRGVLDTDGARRAGPALARRLHAGRGAHAASVREDLERRAAGSGAGARRGLAAPPSR